MKQHKLEYIEKLNIINVKPEFVVIWLHGLGADYNDFVPIVSQLKINKCLKFIFPNAPYRKITVNNDMEMRAWYDIRDLNKLGDTVDREGILTSVHQIEDLIESRSLTQIQASKILGIPQPKISALLNGKLSGFSVEKLFSFLNLLDQNIEILVHQKPHISYPATLSVLSAR